MSDTTTKSVLIRIEAQMGQVESAFIHLSEVLVRVEMALDRVAKAGKRAGVSTDKAGKSAKQGAAGMKGLQTSTDRAADSLNRYQRNAKMSANQVRTFGDILKKGRKDLEIFSFNVWKVAMNVALWGGIFVGAAAALNELVETGTKLVGIRAGFDAIAASGGYLAEDILPKVKEATMGLVTEMDIMRNYNTAVSLGIKVTADEFATMSGAAIKMSKVMGTDVNYALNSLITGLGRQSMRVLDNIGVMLKVGEAHRIYAARLGKTVSQLTDAQKKIAFTTIAIERMKENIARSGPVVLSLGDAFKAAKVELTDTVQQLAAYIVTGNSALTTGNAWKDAVADISKTLMENKEEIRAVILQLVDFGTSVAGVVKSVGGWMVTHGQLLLAIGKVAVVMTFMKIISSMVLLMGRLAAAEKVAAASSIVHRKQQSFMTRAVRASVMQHYKLIRAQGHSRAVAIETAKAYTTVTTQINVNTGALATNIREWDTWKIRVGVATAYAKAKVTSFVATTKAQLASAARSARKFVLSLEGGLLIGYGIGKGLAYAADQMANLENAAEDAETGVLELDTWDKLVRVLDKFYRVQMVGLAGLAKIASGDLNVTKFAAQLGKAVREFKDEVVGDNVEIALSAGEAREIYEKEWGVAFKNSTIAYGATKKMQLALEIAFANSKEKTLAELTDVEKAELNDNKAHYMKALLGKGKAWGMVVGWMVKKTKVGYAEIAELTKLLGAVPGKDDDGGAEPPGKTAEQMLGMPDFAKIQEKYKALQTILNDKSKSMEEHTAAMTKYSKIIRTAYFEFFPKADKFTTVQDMITDFNDIGKSVGALGEAFTDLEAQDALDKVLTKAEKKANAAALALDNLYKKMSKHTSGLQKSLGSALGGLDTKLGGVEKRESSPAKEEALAYERLKNTINDTINAKYAMLEADALMRGAFEEHHALVYEHMATLEEYNARLEETDMAQWKAFGDEKGEMMTNFFMGLTEGLMNTGELVAEFGQQLQNTLVDGFTDMIMGVLLGTQTLAEGFQNMAKAILGSIVSMLVQMAAQWLIKHVIMGAIVTAFTAHKIANDTAQAQSEVVKTGIILAANSAVTIASLIAAAAKTFEAHANIPWVGIAIAVGLIAVMMAAMSSMKGKAAKTSGAGGAMGGIDEVPGDKSSPSTWYVHGGEMVVPADPAKKLRGFMDRLERTENDSGGFGTSSDTLLGKILRALNDGPQQAPNSNSTWGTVMGGGLSQVHQGGGRTESAGAYGGDYVVVTDAGDEWGEGGNASSVRVDMGNTPIVVNDAGVAETLAREIGVQVGEQIQRMSRDGELALDPYGIK